MHPTRNLYEASNLGKFGNFREVTESMQIENILETKVRGPATARHIEQKLKETKANSLAPSTGDLMDEIVGEFQLRDDLYPVRPIEWRTNPNKYTRYDIDFIDHIEESFEPKNQRIDNKSDTMVSQFENIIGPRFKDKYYVNAEIEASADLNSGSTVKEQLEGRVIQDNKNNNSDSASTVENDDNHSHDHLNNRKTRLNYSKARKQIALKALYDKINQKDTGTKGNRLLLDEVIEPNTNVAMMSQLISKTLNNRQQMMNVKRDFRRFMKRAKQQYKAIRKDQQNNDVDDVDDKEKVCTRSLRNYIYVILVYLHWKV